MVRGLKQRTDLNGLVVRVTAYNKESGRCVVVMDPRCEEGASPFCVKPDNLLLLSQLRSDLMALLDKEPNFQRDLCLAMSNIERIREKEKHRLIEIMSPALVNQRFISKLRETIGREPVQMAVNKIGPPSMCYYNAEGCCRLLGRDEWAVQAGYMAFSCQCGGTEVLEYHQVMRNKHTGQLVDVTSDAFDEAGFRWFVPLPTERYGWELRDLFEQFGLDERAIQDRTRCECHGGVCSGDKTDFDLDKLMQILRIQVYHAW